MEPSSDNETARALGRLEARVAAVEERLDRSEASYAARLAVIEAKLDHLTHSVSQGLGALRLAHWIGAALLALAGYVANELLHTKI